MMLRRVSLSLRTGTHFTRRLSTSSPSPSPSPATAEKEGKEEDGKSSGFFSSWVGKIKSTFASVASPSPSPGALLDCADMLEKVTRVDVARVVKLRPDLSVQTFVESLDKASTICRALGKHNPNGENVDITQKMLAAEECGCTILEVEKALKTFDWYKRIGIMHEKGDKVPETREEMKAMFGSTLAARKPEQTQSRNAPCTCGSGKKFKRCCGRRSVEST